MNIFQRIRRGIGRARLGIGGSPAPATRGTPYNFTPSAKGGRAPYTFSIGGSLPSGLNFNPSTGAVTGTPS